MVAGTKHGAGSFPPADNGGQFRENTNNYRWAQRGLLASLDAWVRHGTAPPPSRHPRLVDGTLVAHRDLKFPAIPGVQWPTHVPGGFRPDVPGPDSVLPFLLPAIDADGNDIGGIRLPEQAVPLATLTGWQFRSERIGLPHTLLAMAGAYIPFPLTRAERERTGDPRLSIEERYPSRDDYLAKVRQAAIRLAQERYLIEADVDPIVEDAARHWDWLVGGAGGTTPPHGSLARTRRAAHQDGPVYPTAWITGLRRLGAARRHRLPAVHSYPQNNRSSHDTTRPLQARRLLARVRGSPRKFHLFETSRLPSRPRRMSWR